MTNPLASKVRQVEEARPPIICQLTLRQMDHEVPKLSRKSSPSPRSFFLRVPPLIQPAGPFNITSHGGSARINLVFDS